MARRQITATAFNPLSVTGSTPYTQDWLGRLAGE